jgi:hypothetical protein
MADTKCWFQKDGVDLKEGIETHCRFKTAGGLEIYDVLHNGERIGEIYAGYPRDMKDGYSFRLEQAT